MDRKTKLELFREKISNKYVINVMQELNRQEQYNQLRVKAEKGYMKKCKKCGKILPLDNFYYHPLKKGKRFDICKDCVRKRQKEYRRKKKWENKLL